MFSHGAERRAKTDINADIKPPSRHARFFCCMTGVMTGVMTGAYRAGARNGCEGVTGCDPFTVENIRAYQKYRIYPMDIHKHNKENRMYRRNIAQLSISVIMDS